MMQLEPAVLENRFVRLELLSEAHRDGLRAACAADTQIWAALYPYSMAGEHFDPRWTQLMADAARGATLAFAAVAAGEVVGMTSYLGMDPANGSTEVGATYYRPD